MTERKEGQWLSHRRFCGVVYLGLAKAILDSFDRNRNRGEPYCDKKGIVMLAYVLKCEHIPEEESVTICR